MGRTSGHWYRGNVAYVERTRNADEGPRSVRCVLRVDGQKLIVSTGVSIEKEFWDATNQIVRGHCYLAKDMNAQISKVKDDLARAYMQVRNSGLPLTRENVRSQYDAISDSSLTTVLSRYIEVKRSREECPRKARSLLHHIEELIGTDPGWSLLVSNLSDNFYDALRTYFNAKELRESTQDSYFRQLRACLKWAERNGVGASPLIGVISSRKLDVRPEYSEFLYKKEIEAIASCRDLPPDLQLARAYLVAQIKTGVRWGDLSRLSSREINVSLNESGDYVLRFHNKKAKKLAIVLKLDARTIEFLRYAQSHSPLTLSTYNRHLKRILGHLGLDRPVQSNDGETSAKLDALISSHSFKRTFVMRKSGEGYLPQDICTMTGNSLRTIEAYLPHSERALHDAHERIRAARQRSSEREVPSTDQPAPLYLITNPAMIAR